MIMSEWKEVTLKEITELVIDYRGKTPLKLGGEWSNHGYRALSAKNVKTGIIVSEESIRYVNEDLYKKWLKDEVQKGDILITSEAPFGEVYYWNTDEKIVLSQRLFDVRIKKDVCSQYVYYYMTSYPFQAELRSRASGTTVLGLRQPELLKTKVILPDYETQVKIADQLSEIDSKIENNRKICANLEAQAQALFKHWFIDFAPFKDGKFVESELGMIPEGWRVSAAMDLYNINIGKTPPRQEPIWFSKDQNDVKWISISDLGKSGIFIMDSSEKLTKEAIKKHHIIVVPKNTILLSFKLTIGRVAICNSDMTTNEAIARFYLNDKSEMEYLYMYLKNYKYELLGSTSSIATAVNSKIIKKMCILKPPFEVINKFHSVVNPLFERIRANIEENDRLSTLRDTLLPKLMSGEIKV